MLYSADRLAALLVTAIAAAGCADLDTTSTGDAPSWEELEAGTHRLDDGRYVVDGDTPIADAAELRAFYDRLRGDDALVIHGPGGTPVQWDNATKRNLTYCVSTSSFGARHARAAAAMARAAAAWEAVADADFVYVPQQNGHCTSTNTNVLFAVTYSVGEPFLAVSFFPTSPRRQRNLIIDASAFGNLGRLSLTGLLRHELGHVLGFRHEHTRPEAGQCFEDSHYLELTPYDSSSVMHYPQCNGSQLGDLVLTPLDIEGVRKVYGARGHERP